MWCYSQLYQYMGWLIYAGEKPRPKRKTKEFRRESET